jgi:DNA-binding response OmpR family regulator
MGASRAAILLVEDDDNDVLLVQRAFQKSGVQGPMPVVGDGDAAVAYLAGTGDYADRARYPVPEAVLLDLKLPRRSGLEVLAWARGQARLHGLPIVVLTSSREPADLDEAYRLGANSYLVKPVAFDQLLAMTRAFREYWLGLNQTPEAGSA